MDNGLEGGGDGEGRKASVSRLQQQDEPEAETIAVVEADSESVAKGGAEKSEQWKDLAAEGVAARLQAMSMDDLRERYSTTTRR